MIKKINHILIKGFSINTLKTIALCAMVIDHIGYYYKIFLPVLLYSVLRGIGRIAMPIFVYTLVQGFFHTKNFKKYLTRIIICAVVTQVLITACMLLNFRLTSEYNINIYKMGNILFTFAICLSLMKILHSDNLIKKWDYNKNLSLKIILTAVILIVTSLVPLDYGIKAVMLCILFYYIERLKIYVYINKTNSNVKLNFKSIVYKGISDEKIRIVYIVLLLMALVIINIYYEIKIYALFAIIPIALYNGEKGKDSKLIKYIYYYIFPLQHVLLYLGAMFITFT